MRCLDKHWDEIFGIATDEHKRDVREFLVAVDIDNVTKWFFQNNSQEYWDYEKDFPCALSPWRMAWFESGAPQYSNSEGQQVRMSNDLFRKIGWLVHSYELPADFDVPRENVAMTWYRKQNPLSGQLLYTNEQMISIKARKPRHTQMILSHSFTWEGEMIPSLGIVEYLDADGVLISDSRQIMLMVPGHSRLSMDQRQMMVDGLQAIYLPLYFSLSLIHTKNIVLKNEPVVRGQINRKDRSPQTRFRTLDINPLKEQIRNTQVESLGQTEIQRALHLCRGHFRRYTEDRKLFGKHIGVFWIPEHKRGSKERGEIKKDYRLSL